MLTPLNIVQIYFIADTRISRIINYIISSFHSTLWISVWIFVATAFYSGILILIVNQSFIYLLSLVFIGMCGSTYELILEKNEHSSRIALYII
jgi:hypothetical protein